MTRKWFGAALAAVTCAAAFVGIGAPTFAAGQATPTPKMAKKLPPRNAKGQFMKASPKPATAKALPPRDAKGHFMKMPAATTTKMTPKMAPKMTSATTKKLPPRNAKGQFMKASPSPVAPKK